MLFILKCRLQDEQWDKTVANITSDSSTPFSLFCQYDLDVRGGASDKWHRPRLTHFANISACCELKGINNA